MRNSIRQIDGLLSDPNLHTVRSNRYHLVGQFLAEQKRYACSSSSGRDYCAHDDHVDVIYQCGLTKDFLHQIHRRVPGDLFRHGLRFALRYSEFGLDLVVSFIRTQAAKRFFSVFVEYATVGYMAKRLQMRKGRVLQLQRLVERKSTMPDYGRSSTMYGRPSFCGSQYDCDHTPKQTVSTNQSSAKFSVYKVSKLSMQNK